MRTQQQEGIAVIGKMARILDLLAIDSSINATQLSQRLDIPRTTIHRILQTLIAENVITPNHTLDSRPIRWASRALKELGISKASVESLERLAAKFEETATVFLRSGSSRICIDRREPIQQVRHSIDAGVTMPLHVGSAGRVLLAWLTDEERKTLIEESASWSGLPADPYHTDWGEVRTRGYVMTSGERDPLLASVSVPVFGDDGQVVLALCLSGPRMRMPDERLIAMAKGLREEADVLGQRIGRVGFR